MEEKKQLLYSPTMLPSLDRGEADGVAERIKFVQSDLESRKDMMQLLKSCEGMYAWHCAFAWSVYEVEHIYMNVC